MNKILQAFLVFFILTLIILAIVLPTCLVRNPKPEETKSDVEQQGQVQTSLKTKEIEKIPITFQKKQNIKKTSNEEHQNQTEENEKESLEQWVQNIKSGKYVTDPAHLLIGSVHCADVRFLKYKYETFEKFSVLPCTYLIFNDAAPGSHNYHEIKSFCEEHASKIIHIAIPAELHCCRQLIFPDTQEPSSDHPSCRNSLAVQCIWEIMKHHQGYSFILDEDTALISSFHPESWLKKKNDSTAPNFVVASVFQSYGITLEGESIESLRLTFSLFDTPNMPDKDDLFWDSGRIKGVPVDAGGCSHFWLSTHRELARTIYDVGFAYEYPYEDEIARIGRMMQPFPEFCSRELIHKRAGSNWPGWTSEINQEHKRLYFEILDYALSLPLISEPPEEALVSTMPLEDELNPTTAPATINPT